MILFDRDPDFLPKKRFGQNFLVDQRTIDRIIEHCELSSDEAVLEIGPGQAALTRGLMARVKHVIAVESDRVLAARLKAGFDGQNITVYQDDILKFDFSVLPRPLKVVGNIPYNISTPIIARIIENRSIFSSFFITAQYEFGARLVARPGSRDYSSLSCFTQMFAKPKMLFKISPGAFRPAPKIVSCFMRVDLRQEPAEKIADEDVFVRIVRQAFQQRRKTLLNSLSGLCSKAKMAAVLEEALVDPMLRAEDLGLDAYARITNVYHKKTNLLS